MISYIHIQNYYYGILSCCYNLFLNLFFTFIMLFLTSIIFLFIIIPRVVKFFMILFFKITIVIITLPVVIFIPILEQIIIYKHYIFKMVYINIIWNICHFELFNESVKVPFQEKEKSSFENRIIVLNNFSMN